MPLRSTARVLKSLKQSQIFGTQQRRMLIKIPIFQHRTEYWNIVFERVPALISGVAADINMLWMMDPQSATTTD